MWTATVDADELLDAAARGRGARRPDLQGRRHARPTRTSQAREAIVRVPRPDVRRRWRCRTSSPSCPPRPAASAGPARRSGQHNDEVYGDLLGLSEARRAELAGAAASSDVDRDGRLRRASGSAAGSAGAPGPRSSSSTWCTAYLEGGPLTDDGGRFESARASAARVVDAARAAGHPVIFTAVKLAARRRRRRLVRGQGARAARLRGRLAVRRLPRRARRRRRARSWSPSSTPRRSSAPASPRP